MMITKTIQFNSKKMVEKNLLSFADNLIFFV